MRQSSATALRPRLENESASSGIDVTFFSNADIPVAFETLAWVQSFLVEPHAMMKRSAKSTGEPVCPFAKAVLDESALYMAFGHHGGQWKERGPDRIHCPWLPRTVQEKHAFS